MNGVLVEIRAAEGGDDAKGLVREQFNVYAALCKRHGLDVEITEDRSGLVVMEVVGRGAKGLFAHEAGGHRWQRVPPTERRGRRHTSTVTVAVFPIVEEREWVLHENELEEENILGSGHGGQHQQKNATTIRLKHVPTGIVVKVTGRSLYANRKAARAEMEARVSALRAEEEHAERSTDRARQVGSGQRGDKIRTVRMQDGRVVDHRTGRRTSVERYMKGFIEDLA